MTKTFFWSKRNPVIVTAKSDYVITRWWNILWNELFWAYVLMDKTGINPDWRLCHNLRRPLFASFRRCDVSEKGLKLCFARKMFHIVVSGCYLQSCGERNCRVSWRSNMYREWVGDRMLSLYLIVYDVVVMKVSCRCANVFLMKEIFPWEVAVVVWKQVRAVVGKALLGSEKSTYSCKNSK